MCIVVGAQTRWQVKVILHSPEQGLVCRMVWGACAKGSRPPRYVCIKPAVTFAGGATYALSAPLASRLRGVLE